MSDLVVVHPRKRSRAPGYRDAGATATSVASQHFTWREPGHPEQRTCGPTGSVQDLADRYRARLVRSGSAQEPEAAGVLEWLG